MSRISTSATHAAAVAHMMKQQLALSKTQSQVASGKRFETPADDPIAATRVLDLQRNQQELEQYQKNSNLLQSRLNIGEQSLASVNDVLTRVRELVVRANNGTMDAGSRASIAAEIRSRGQELLDIANRRDASGEYLFAGYSTGAQPFARGVTCVDYSADQGVRMVQIGPNQKVPDGFPGSQVFMDIPQGNGTFVTAQGTHAGTGSIDPGQVTNPAAWVRDTYTITFDTASSYQVHDSGGTLVTSGPYTAGNSIAFNGISVTVSGAPAVNDTFTLSPAGTESVFDTLDSIVAALSGADDPSANSTMGTDVARALKQLDQAANRAIDLRGELGARLSAIDTAEASRQQLADELTASVSQLRDIDYAEAISRMNQQLVGLQAAQAAYAKISQLSLFNYL